MARPIVIVAGSINVDYTFAVHAFPSPGSTVAATSVERRHGGKGANQALAAARGGAATFLIGAVGDDADGVEAVQHLAAHGVNVDAVSTVRDATGMAAVLVNERARENEIVVAGAANARLDPHRVEAEITRILSRRSPAAGTPSVLVNFEVPDAVVVAAATAGQRHGARVIVNPAPYRALPAGLSGIVLTPNDSEARALLASGDADLRRAFDERLASRLAALIVTRGREGADLVTADEHRRVAAPRVDAVDPTGAGDVFNGILAAELASGAPLADAVAAAVRAASASTTEPGAQVDFRAVGPGAGFAGARR